MQIRDEHDAFQTIIQGLKIATSGCKEMARYRPDQEMLWLKMAEVIDVSANSVYKFGEESVARKVKS